MKRIIAAALGAGVIACGGSNSIDGTVNGKTFDAKDAIVGTWGFGSPYTIIEISNVSDRCSLMNAAKTPRNHDKLTFLVLNTTSNRALPVTPGEYEIRSDFMAGGPPGRYAFAGFDRTDDQCENSLLPADGNATSGTLTITAIELTEGGKAEGTFELVVGKQGDKVTGTFGASYCDAPDYGKTDPVCI